MLYKTALFLLLSATLVGCNSSSNEDIPANNDGNNDVIIETDTQETSQTKDETYTGIFLDSAVQGLTYSTETQSGKTNELGEFSYVDGETITFSLGGIEFPSIPAALYVTPLSLYDTTNIDQVEVVNLLRLLQTLDIDGDASNGITLSDTVQTLATNLTVDFSASNFEQQVTTLVSQSGSATQALISAEQATAHFQLTLAEINNKDMTQCTKNSAQIGYSGYFSTLAHNVSGLATIIDDCTIEITEFSYDGGGPEVYFYGAINHDYASNTAFAIGPKLTGTTYNNDTLQITLPQGKSLDDLTGLSVWCVDFNANFGQMEFTP